LVYYSTTLNIDRGGDDGSDRVKRGDLLDSTTVFVGALQVLPPPDGGSSSSSKSVWNGLPEELGLLLQLHDPVVIAWSAEHEELLLIVSCALRLPGHDQPPHFLVPCTSPAPHKGGGGGPQVKSRASKMPRWAVTPGC
jgi:hypothetical protein